MTAAAPPPVADAERVLRHALAAPARLAGGRLVCIDGPAGSGKTTLAAVVAGLAAGRVDSVTVLHMDDLYQGWDGLGDVAARIRDGLLGPLASGGPGRYRRWDWVAGAWAEEHLVGPCALLVLEGVGSGSRELRRYLSTLVWVEAPQAERLSRGLARDGEAMRGHWQRWLASEAAHFARHGTREAADLVVDGSSPAPTEPGRSQPGHEPAAP